jgi:hypothetical protein
LSSSWSVVHELATPHPVYGIEWASDGESFAFAGGHLYGKGFLGLASAEGEPIVPPWTNRGRPQRLILSNVAFARAGSRELIVAAAAGYKWHGRGPLVFERCAKGLRLIDAPRLIDEDLQHDQAIGVAVHRGRLHVHHRAKSLAGSLAVHRCRADGLEADELALARHDARIAVIGDRLWIAKQRKNVYSIAGTGAPLVPGSDIQLIEDGNPHGVAGWDLDDLAAPPEWIDLPVEWRLNTMVRDPAGERLWLGLGDHGLAKVDLATRRFERVGELARGSGSDPPVVRGVLALAFTPDGLLIAAEHAGAIGWGRDGEWEATLQLPRGLAARSLAIDPSGARLAIGCKHGGNGYEPGAVLLLARS